VQINPDAFQRFCRQMSQVPAGFMAISKLPISATGLGARTGRILENEASHTVIAKDDESAVNPMSNVCSGSAPPKSQTIELPGSHAVFLRRQRSGRAHREAASRELVNAAAPVS